MKLSLTMYGKTVSIETEHDDGTFDEFMEEVVRPVIVGSGWSEELWQQYWEERHE